MLLSGRSRIQAPFVPLFEGGDPACLSLHIQRWHNVQCTFVEWMKEHIPIFLTLGGFSLGLLCSRLSKIQIRPYHWLVKSGNPLSYRNWRALKALSQCFSNCGLWLMKSLKSKMESMEECIAREWGKYCLGNICVCAGHLKRHPRCPLTSLCLCTYCFFIWNVLPLLCLGTSNYPSSPSLNASATRFSAI